MGSGARSCGPVGAAVELRLDGTAVVSVGVETCGADLTSDLPIWLLNSQFDFSNLCQGKTYKKVFKKAPRAIA